jgi:hypothetical protein
VNGQWHSHQLVSERDGSIERRWLSIPPNTWHQAVVPRSDWVVVSFHTVADHELIEERPEAGFGDQTRQPTYWGRESE